MESQKVQAVPSIMRAVSVLEFLAGSGRGFSLSEISRKLKLPKSSTSLILKTLESQGFLQRNAPSGRYYFGLRLVRFSRKIIEHLDLREVAKTSFGKAHATNRARCTPRSIGRQRSRHHR